jgi:serine/threonine protein kinase
MRCTSCSREVAESTTFCGFCGEPCPPNALETRTYAAPSPSTTSEMKSLGRFPSGTIVARRYMILHLLGRGGMGEVYRAIDLKLDQSIAIKFLSEAKAGLPDFAARLYSEVRIARQISHENICRVYDIGEFENQPFITMEYVDGENLQSLLRRIGRLPPDRATEVARRVCLGLAAAHEKGVLHRDLKPGNIMIDGRGQAVITDFGVAAFANELLGREADGTPVYMAPEQLVGKNASVQSDLYSLGLVMFEMFTGKRPFDATSAKELAEARQAMPFLSPSSLAPGVDPLIDRIVEQCLDPDPRARPASALAVAAVLPGQDPLEAAIAAGETPSPEMVAKSGAHEGLRPRVALLCTSSVFVMLALFATLSGRASLIEQSRLEKSLDSLDESSRRILGGLGYTGSGRDHARGFFFSSPFLQLDGDRPPPSPVDPRATSSSPIAYWYRDNPGFFQPRTFLCCDVVPGGVGMWQPPMHIPGERLLVLDTRAQLQYLAVVPGAEDIAVEVARRTDWPGVFAAAGLSMNDFQSTNPLSTPPFFADERAAWQGTAQSGRNVPLRVEAAALRGRVVFFDRGDGASRRRASERPPAPPAQHAANIINAVLIIVVTTLGLAVALRNVRLRRGDRRGAFRLFAAGYLIDALTWVLLVDHVPEPNYELHLIEMASSWASLRAAVLWVAYVAIEPYVRRRWPHSMVSWSRLLAGRFNDAKLGGDILVGIAAGCATALLFQLNQAFIRPWVDLGPLTAMRGPRQAFGLWVADLHSSVVLAFLTLVLFLLLRTLLRRSWLAIATVCLIQGAAAISAGLAASVVIAVQYLLVLLFLVRLGLVTIATGIFVYTVLVSFPVTANLFIWYAGTSMFALLSIAVIAAAACWSTLTGRRLIRDELW